MKKDKKYQDDDGRVIADMNVDGMPWNSSSNRLFGGFAPNRLLKKKNKSQARTQFEPVDNKVYLQQEEVTNKETRVLIFNALLAVFLIAGIFLLAAFLFILFCQYVWLR